MTYPAIKTKGIFVVKTPYTVTPDVEYEVVAIASYSSLRSANIDVEKVYYTDMQLDPALCKTDEDAGAVIVTLVSNGSNIVRLPSTYILEIPGNPGVPYSHLVLGASLGALPDDFDATLLISAVSQTIADYIGVTPDVKIARAASSGMITAEQHAALERARLDHVAINDTPLAQVRELQELVAQQAERMRLLEEWIAAHPDS